MLGPIQFSLSLSQPEWGTGLKNRVQRHGCRDMCAETWVRRHGCGERERGWSGILQ